MTNKIIKQFTEEDAIRRALEIIDGYSESERPHLMVSYERPDGSLRSGTFKLISYTFECLHFESVMNEIKYTMGLDWIFCLEVLVEE